MQRMSSWSALRRLGGKWTKRNSERFTRTALGMRLWRASRPRAEDDESAGGHGSRGESTTRRCLPRPRVVWTALVVLAKFVHGLARILNGSR